jgi:alpha-ribazole phosphatase
VVQLTIVRHAQPLIATGVCYGTLDVPADTQATALAAASIATLLPPHAKLYCSPLQRCTALALQVQALRPELTMLVIPQLCEMDFGAWEGQPWDSIDAQTLSAWTDDFENYRCGGTGESAGQFVARVHSAVLQTAQTSGAVWITHAGVARAIAWLCQRPGLPFWQPLCPPLYLVAGEWALDGPGFGQLQHWDLPLQ